MIVVELRKLVRRPRTWVSLALLVGLPCLVAVFVGSTDVAPRPGEGPAFLSAVLNDGRLFPLAALALDLPLFLPVAVAVAGGDAIAGEASAGTLRYLLLRPVGRSRLLVAKLISVLAYTATAVVLIVAAGYVVGVLIFGTSTTSAVTSVSGVSLTPGQVIVRMLMAMGYVGWSMLGVAAIALFLSTTMDSALGAALGALAALVTSQVLAALDAATSVHPYLPTRYWLAWIDLFREPILWHDVVRGIGIQAVYVVVLLGAAWARFLSKDITT